MASTEIGRPVESDPIVNPLANLCLGISFCIPPLLLLLALGMFGQPAFSGLPGMSALLYVSYAPIGGVVLLALLVIALCLMLRLKGLIIPKTPLFKASVALLIGIAEFVLVLSLRDSVHRFHSALNLKVIGIASHAHHRDHEHFPGNILSADGKPLLSWRVALLPDLNEDSLYRRFKLDEPWDSPSNRELLSDIPRVYKPVADRTCEPGSTFYQGFVGKGTAREKSLSAKDFPDGLSDTLLVVEASEAVPWTKPADIAYDPEKPVPELGGFLQGPFWFDFRKRVGFVATFADGHTEFFPKGTLSEAALRALITRNGGEKIDRDELP